MLSLIPTRFLRPLGAFCVQMLTRYQPQPSEETEREKETIKLDLLKGVSFYSHGMHLYIHMRGWVNCFLSTSVLFRFDTRFLFLICFVIFKMLWCLAC